MSLKAFHIFFICVSVLLALGLCALSLQTFLAERTLVSGCCTVMSGFAALALTLYGLRFLEKLKHVRFL